LRVALDVTDLSQLVELIEAHPEWRVQLRRVLLDDELARLRLATEEQARKTDERFAELAARLDALTGRVDQLTERVDVVTDRLGRLTDRVDQLTVRLDRLTDRVDQLAVRVDQLTIAVTDLTAVVRRQGDDLGEVKGWALEARYRDRPHAYFGAVLRRARAATYDDVPSLWEAYDAGRIDRDDWNDLHRLDVLVQGVDRAAATVFVAMEVAYRADASDVDRAVRRARTLALSGARVVPAVGTKEADAELIEHARDAGAALFAEGEMLHWPGGQSAA
jgi:hypothetical protein